MMATMEGGQLVFKPQPAQLGKTAVGQRIAEKTPTEITVRLIENGNLLNNK